MTMETRTVRPGCPEHGDLGCGSDCLFDPSHMCPKHGTENMVGRRCRVGDCTHAVVDHGGMPFVSTTHVDAEESSLTVDKDGKHERRKVQVCPFHRHRKLVDGKCPVGDCHFNGPRRRSS